MPAGKTGRVNFLSKGDKRRQSDKMTPFEAIGKTWQNASTYYTTAFPTGGGPRRRSNSLITPSKPGA